MTWDPESLWPPSYLLVSDAAMAKRVEERYEKALQDGTLHIEELLPGDDGR